MAKKKAETAAAPEEGSTPPAEESNTPPAEESGGGKINKSEMIRTVYAEMAADGKRLTAKPILEELQRRFPNETWTAGAINVVLSKLRGGGGKKAATDQPSLPGMSAAGETPFLQQLEAAVKLLGKDGVKKLVDGL